MGKTPQQIKGNAKELELDVLARLVSTLTVSNAKVLRNVYVPYAKGSKTTEIDMLLLAHGSIYVFEVKNYRCTVVGRQRDRDWKAIYSPNRSYDLYNPILQNQGHVSTLASYLKLPESRFKSVVVFSEKADISRVEYSKSDSLRVLTMDAVVPYLVLQKVSKGGLSDDELRLVYDRVKPLTKVSKSTKEQHVRDVNSKKR